MQLGLILESGRKLLHLPLTYFEGRRSGEVVSRIADVSAVNALVSQIVLGLLSEFFIAIARAIITAAILILDESTGALDSVSEAEVLNRMLYYWQGTSTILISHRPKVIQRADWIVLLEEGRLKIPGTPETLRSFAGEHLDFLGRCSHINK